MKTNETFECEINAFHNALWLSRPIEILMYKIILFLLILEVSFHLMIYLELLTFSPLWALDLLLGKN